jgi:chromosome segregation ATPase
MDINKVQKLNEMAMNLKKHNVVFSKEDAIKQAESIYGSEHNYATEEVVQNSEQVDELRKDVRKLTFALRDALNEINDLKSQVTKLSRELNDVRVDQQPRKIEEKRVEKVAQQTLKQEEKAKKITSPIDRNGISPEDVSIEKFFYFGEK